MTPLKPTSNHATVLLRRPVAPRQTHSKGQAHVMAYQILNNAPSIRRGKAQIFLYE